METTFYQARSGRIYMKCEWVDFKYNRHSCETDLIEPQVTSLLPAIMNSIDFNSETEFDLDNYGSAYSMSSAETLYTILSEKYHIEPESRIKERVNRFHQLSEDVKEIAYNVPLSELNLSSRAFNILAKCVYDGHYTAASILKAVTPSLMTIRGCGIQTATEIVNAFYKAGIPCERWCSDLKDNKYFIEHFIGNAEKS